MSATVLPGRALLMQGAPSVDDRPLRRIQQRADHLRFLLVQALERNCRTLGDGEMPVCVACLEGIPYCSSAALLSADEPRLAALRHSAAAQDAHSVPPWSVLFGDGFGAIAVVCLDCSGQFSTLQAFGPDLFPEGYDAPGPFRSFDPEDF